MSDQTKKRRHYSWIGHGVYTTAEAARLTGISAGRIRRWFKGYSFIRSGERRSSLPLLNTEIERDHGPATLTFKDLVEVMCVHAFLKTGVSLTLLRRAHERAVEVLGTGHPFATRKFLTDGHSVLLKIKEQVLLDVATDQYTFVKILSPYLKTDGLEFDGQFASRWWPMGKKQPVVIDAQRSFGQPIVIEGVPTVNLYRAYIAEVRVQANRKQSASKTLQTGTVNPIAGHVDQGLKPLSSRVVLDRLEEVRFDEKTIRYVGNWYSVSGRSVKAAIEYESRLAA